MRTECPLFPEPYYSFTIDLSSETYTLTFRWNDRAEQWFMMIEDAEENVLIRNIALVPYYPLLQQYSLKEPLGEFILIPIEESDLATAFIKEPREIYKTHWLLYDDFQD